MKVTPIIADFLHFINKSPSPFHAVHQASKTLREAGFTELSEASGKWDVKPNGKYFVTKNSSMVMAFAVGGGYKPGNGITMIGAHTDSPCFKVKPSFKREKNGFHQVGVQLYGGGIWHTWFDRDLKVAGRVVLKNKDGKLEQHLVDYNRPCMRIPTLAIHLDRTANEQLSVNKESHLTPVAGLLNGTEGEKSPLMEMLCGELNVEAEQILDYELCLADHQPASIGGFKGDFVFAPRLDNLFNTYAALQALIAADALEADPNIRMIMLFDNEEVGSMTAQGACSVFVNHTLHRLVSHEDMSQTMAKSMMLSADQAHGCHPNYAEKHESCHQPKLNEGMVLKFNANQRYASTAVTASILRIIAAKVDVKLQDFVVKNDSPCGSTIGPISAADLGVQTLDIGGAQLSMHSIREMCSTDSVADAVKLFAAYFELFPVVLGDFKVVEPSHQ